MNTQLWAVVSLLFAAFQISLVVVTLIFVDDVEEVMKNNPTLDQRMLNFIWVGNWIYVAILGLLLVGGVAMTTYYMRPPGGNTVMVADLTRSAS